MSVLVDEPNNPETEESSNSFWVSKICVTRCPCCVDSSGLRMLVKLSGP